MVQSSERFHPQLSYWGEILDTFEDRTIFQTPTWVSFIAETQKAEPVFAALKDGPGTVGYFSGLIVRKFGLKIFGSPLPGWTTSYMGMNLSQGVSRRLGLEAIVRLAFGELNCVHVEIMDRNVSVDDARGPEGHGTPGRRLASMDPRESCDVQPVLIKLFIPSISIPMFGNPFPDC